MVKRDFTWTSERQAVTVWTAVAPAIAAIVAALLVLGLSVKVYRNPHTRGSLKRQSLQVLMSVQAASIIYSATYIGEMLITGPTHWCNACIVLTLWASNYIDFCVMLIPVNLQLALVHGVRTEGWAQWYMGGSFLAATIISIPGAVKDVWGWDPESLICWTKITDASQRNAWQIGAFYAWQLFTMAVASISTLVVIAHLFRYARTMEHRIVAAHSTSTGGQHIVRAVAWRVIVYPLILIFTNCVSAAGNFTITSAGGILSDTTYNLWIVSGILYGLMPLSFALVTLFVDPSFNHAIRGLAFSWSPSSSTRTSRSVHTHPKPPTTIEIELSRVVTVHDDSKQPMSASPTGALRPDAETQPRKTSDSAPSTRSSDDLPHKMPYPDPELGIPNCEISTHDGQADLSMDVLRAIYSPPPTPTPPDVPLSDTSHPRTRRHSLFPHSVVSAAMQRGREARTRLRSHLNQL
ncbi:hypothetical protein PUNSTDRAFT_46155 [Punctularia strigosozonata HHB-11173 SS5]|uniref:uncharacterized protein n=1 Tax=Punctularia strigosozonata (strain HHB-11173) TaxID=741275 RepID=UPI00044179F5|nr:uncharacterized protein PUNSTDRAFT_46155 [Punctularia strigosozonata HHB-11173 SS5]EIN06756.1 hypothetical protein PUNSTDRAFT_46155 [Punctularia strigosozonata HHB-11173 SS5]